MHSSSSQMSPMALLPFLSLFLSTFLLQLGLGSTAPVDAIAGAAQGFSTLTLGLLGTAHFLGFGIGCFLSPPIISRVGHARTFAIAAAVATIGALLHPIFPDAIIWLLLRVGSGLAVAMAYSVIESWFHARATNEIRGRLFGLYRISDMSGSLIAQFLIVLLDPTGYVIYSVIAILCCLGLVPLVATTQQAPDLPKTLKLRPKAVWQISPVAVCGVVVAGMTTSSFRMVTPIFGIELNLDLTDISLLLALTILAGVTGQYPIGWLSDRYGRRAVLIACSGFAMVSCIGLALAADIHSSGLQNLSDGASPHLFWLYLGFILFGVSTFPIYSVSAAHANDFAPRHMSVELSAGLIFYYGVGAVLSPAIASLMIDKFGPATMFFHITLVHMVLIAYTLWRMSRRRAPMRPGEGYKYLPRTSFLQGLLLGGKTSQKPSSAQKTQKEDSEIG